MSKIKIILNGEEKFFEQGISIADLIQNLELDSKKIAIERNLEIADLNSFEVAVLQDGDRIEIVHFIGGG